MPAPVQPIVIFAQAFPAADADRRDAHHPRRPTRSPTGGVCRRSSSSALQVVISTGETTLTLFRQRSFAMIREARLTIPAFPARRKALAMPACEFDDFLDFATWFSKRDDFAARRQGAGTRAGSCSSTATMSAADWARSTASWVTPPPLWRSLTMCWRMTAATPAPTKTARTCSNRRERLSRNGRCSPRRSRVVVERRNRAINWQEIG